MYTFFSEFRRLTSQHAWQFMLPMCAVDSSESVTLYFPGFGPMVSRVNVNNRETENDGQLQKLNILGYPFCLQIELIPKLTQSMFTRQNHSVNMLLQLIYIMLFYPKRSLKPFSQFFALLISFLPILFPNLESIKVSMTFKDGVCAIETEMSP